MKNKIISALLIFAINIPLCVCAQEVQSLPQQGTYISKYAHEKYSIVAAAQQNSGLCYDISAFESNGKYNFVLPYGCDIKNVYTTVYSEDGSVLVNTSVDFSGNDYKDIKIDDTRTVEVSAFNSTLPVIYLDINEEYGTIEAMNKSEDHSVPCYGDFVLDVPPEIAQKLGCESYMTSEENDDKDPGTVRLRGRGNSTWTTETDKQRPYQIKLEKGLNLLGMGKNKEWAILRTETPLKYMRNKICFDMADDFGIKYTPGAEFVDVFLNGSYIGMYTLSNPLNIGSGNIPITEMDDLIKAEGNADNVDITGGYLLEMDNFKEDLQFLAQDNMMTIKAPEKLDTTVEDGSRYDYIKNLMTDLINAVYGDGYLSDGRHFTEVLDMDSAVRYFLHQELIGNYDSCQGSTFFYKDTDEKDSKIYLGPVWDCEFAFELYSSEWCLPYRERYWEPHQPLFVAQLCRHKEFVDYVIAYYFDNLNNNNIRTKYIEYADKVDEYEKSMGNSAKASSMLYKIAEPSNQYISSYIRSKYEFFEKNLRKLVNDASRGVNPEIFANADSEKSDDTIMFIREGKLYYSYENKTEDKKEILLMAYDGSEKLSYIKQITVNPDAKIYGSIDVGNGEKISRIGIYDSELRSYVNTSIKNAQSGKNDYQYVVPGMGHYVPDDSSEDMFLEWPEGMER